MLLNRPCSDTLLRSQTFDSSITPHYSQWLDGGGIRITIPEKRPKHLLSIIYESTREDEVYPTDKHSRRVPVLE